MHSLSLSLPENFSFAECMRFLGRSQQECLHECRDGKIRKLFRTGGSSFLLEIHSQKDKELQIDFLTGRPGKIEEESICSEIQNWFDLSYATAAFYSMAENDELLSPLVKKYNGLRLIGIPDLFEALGWAVTGQQINLSFAYLLKRRLTEEYGEKMLFGNKEFYFYPSAEKIAALQPEDLMNMQFTRRKAEYIIGIAQSIVSGKLSRDMLLCQSPDEAMHNLLQVRGVGEWTSAYVMMKCLRLPDAFPAADAGLHNAIRILMKLKSKPAISEVMRLSESWKGHRAYAAFYLWRSLLQD